jgi:hypothetical protein
MATMVSGPTVNSAMRGEISGRECIISAPGVCTGESLGRSRRDAVSGGNRVLPTIKLDKFCGDTPIRTHLAKFENCAFYYSWSPRDRLCHLKASLDGPAAQVLWENPNVSSEPELVRLLCNRFDNVNQTERFRAELRSRRRRQGESIQSLYQDVRRLMALGFPGQAGELYEIIARDTFLEALAAALRIRVLDQSPITLDDALSIVCRMEAYSGIITRDDGEADNGRRKVRAIGANAANGERGDSTVQKHDKCNKTIERAIAELRKEMQEIRRQFDANCSRSQLSRPASRPGWSNQTELGVAYGANLSGPVKNIAPTGVASMQPGWSSQWMDRTTGPPLSEPADASALVNQQGSCFQATSRQNAGWSNMQQPRRKQAVPRDTCSLCLQKGHWRRECPLRNQNPSVAGEGTSQVRISGVTGDSIGAETYMDVKINGVTAQCLVDSGCDRSIIARRMVSKARLYPTDVKLTAANGADLNVLGRMRLRFMVQNMHMYADLIVSDSIDEFMIGVDFLSRVKAVWDFSEGILLINGNAIPLKQRPSRANVRRVFVREEVIAPPSGVPRGGGARGPWPPPWLTECYF